jgi:hypothetical protein
MSSDQLDRLKRSEQSRRAMLAQWRENQKHEATLPSGLVIMLRDVTMTDLLFTGKLPQSMLTIAQAAATDESSKIDLKDLASNGHDLKLLVNELVLLCVVEPKIAETPDEDHIGIDELNGDDKMFIFNWVNREVEQIRPFREGENQPVAVIQPGNGVWHPSE